MREKEKETRAKSLWTQSAIPLIALSHQPYLYQNIQNLDVLLILGDIECFKYSYWITITIGK